MAIDVYLKLDGIKGESAQKGHEGEIEVLTASFEVSNKAPVASGAGAGKPEFQNIRVTKNTDSASPQLFQFCASGKHISTGTITADVANGGGAHLTIAVTEVVVTSYELGISQQTPSEVITLGFSTLKITYEVQDEKGAVTGTVQSGWDVTKNQAV